MKLIVGLGNVGKEYENTRHNVGFMFVDYYAQKNNLTFKLKDNAYYAETSINNEKVIIIKPTTFMNLSGLAVRHFADFYKINIEDIIVIYDDTAFEVGDFKIKQSGSSGGHNGINDIIKAFSTENIKRVRIGISHNKNDLVDYVLGKFSKEDMNILKSLFENNYRIIDDFVTLPFDHLMNKYNKRD